MTTNDYLEQVSSCKLCESKKTDYIHGYGKQFTICSDCNFIYNNNPDTQKIKKGLGMTAGEGGGYREYYLSKMLLTDLNFKNFLLYGTGNSPTFEKLLKENINVNGCDISRNVVDIKSEKFGKNKFYLPEEIPVEKKYDAVIAVEVFEHFLDPVDSMSFLVSHLSEKGIICGTTEFYQGGPIEDENKYMNAKSHVAYWSLRSMLYLAGQFNMAIEEFEMIRPGSVLPDEKFGLLWPNKRVFFIFNPKFHKDYFEKLKKKSQILPIDNP